jgi:hypothetical protein
VIGVGSGKWEDEEIDVPLEVITMFGKSEGFVTISPVN